MEEKWDGMVMCETAKSVLGPADKQQAGWYRESEAD